MLSLSLSFSHFIYHIEQTYQRFYSIGANIIMLEAKSLFIGTPVQNNEKSRSYLNIYGLHHPSNIKGEKEDSAEEQLQTQEGIVFYGTTINIRDVSRMLQLFIKSFMYEEDEEDGLQKIYINQINDIDKDIKNQYIVDARHIFSFDKQLYYQFIYYPAEMITIFDNVLKEIYNKNYIQSSTQASKRDSMIKKKDSMQTVIKYLRDQDLSSLKAFNAKCIGRLVSIRGVIVKCSPVNPEMKQAHFKCSACKHEVSVMLQNARVSQPKECEWCYMRDSFYLQHNLCEFTDKQYLRMQQLPQDMEEGGIACYINLIAYDDHVQSVRPGDKVQVVGIYRAKSIKVDSSQPILKRLFNTYIDIISFTLLEQKQNNISSRNILFSEEDKQQFYKMAQKQTIINDLVASFSPSIFGHQYIKKGILAQLFGGTKKPNHEGHFRSDINICLVGDPSTAKSQFLQQVNKISPRGLYTNGRGTSEVGLTANVKKDPQTHQFILESGALVISDGGICCIDQFDKMTENSRIILLQVMEQQTISIAKSGIVCQLNSRTSILAAANPVKSKYDPTKSIIQNINLPPTLLSRFDLIFIILDIPNKISDERIASHILDMYSNNPKHVNKGKYQYNLLTKYITFAKQHIHPVLTQEACKKLQDQYKIMRSQGKSTNVITATPRLLESLIRISQAYAKMRLSYTVSENDVQEAVNLVRQATLKAATDPSTGIVDMGMLSTGISSAIAARVKQLSLTIKQMISANENKYRKTTSISNLFDDLINIKKIKSQQINTYQIIQALNILHSEDFIAIFGQDKHNPLFKLQKITQQ